MNHPGSLEVLHKDDDILVVDKPAGLLSAPGRWDPDEATVFTELAAAGEPDLRLVHRLDRETSGVLVIARTLAAQRSLSAQWAGHTVRKEYLALAVGSPPDDVFRVDLPLLDDPDRKQVLAGERRGAKPAHTECAVLERFAGYALLKVRLLTGRRHQIRAHLAALGLPVAADKVYGDGRPVLLSELNRRYKRKSVDWRRGEDGANREEKPLLTRTGLHACRIEFDHPRSGERIAFEALPPADLAHALRALRKYRPN